MRVVHFLQVAGVVDGARLELLENGFAFGPQEQCSVHHHVHLYLIFLNTVSWLLVLFVILHCHSGYLEGIKKVQYGCHSVFTELEVLSEDPDRSEQ